jgi:hypothetical protein
MLVAEAVNASGRSDHIDQMPPVRPDERIVRLEDHEDLTVGGEVIDDSLQAIHPGDGIVVSTSRVVNDSLRVEVTDGTDDLFPAARALLRHVNPALSW